jgi:hypothetical protein
MEYHLVGQINEGKLGEMYHVWVEEMWSDFGEETWEKDMARDSERRMGGQYKNRCKNQVKMSSTEIV